MAGDAMQLTTAQDELVQAIAAAAPQPHWEQIVADVEILEEADGFAMDSVAFAVVKADSGGYAAPPIAIDRPLREKVIDLYRALAATRSGAPLGSFELKIEPDGRYAFSYSYEPPKRLNGEWDEAKETRLDRYAETFAPGRS
jgi:hypothetical protein